MATRVFLLDDHELVRRGLRELISAEDDIVVVGEAGTGEEALRRIPAAKPDVAVLDVRLGDDPSGMTGVEVCREVRSSHPEVACIMLTSYADDEALFASIMAGAAGYVLKQIRGSDLVAGIRRVAAGERLLDPVVTARALERLRTPVADPLAALTPQEHRVLELITDGMTNRQIGAEMFLAEKTVKNYVSRLLTKLGMERRSQAACVRGDARGAAAGQLVSPLRGVNDPERLRSLVGAILAVGSDLSLPVLLRHIVEAAVGLVDARYGALGVLDAAGQGLAEFVNVGMSREQIDAIGHLPAGHGILGLLILEPEPLRLADLGAHPDSYGFPENHPSMGSFLGVPIRVRGQVFGNLYLTDKQGAAEFSEDDQTLAVALGVAAGMAIENTRLLARVQELTLVEDRERIAADLHDTVIQRLFATGLSLQSTVRAIADPAAAGRIQEAVDELDETIRQIRSTIFGLQRPRAAGGSLRDEIRALAAESAASLGFGPKVIFAGDLGEAVDDSIGIQLLAVLREALSNVVRHAGASQVTVSVVVADGVLVASVVDDGVGAGSGERPGGKGLASLHHRAEALGGTLEVRSGDGGLGTTVRWEVPLGPEGR